MILNVKVSSTLCDIVNLADQINRTKNKQKSTYTKKIFRLHKSIKKLKIDRKSRGTEFIVDDSIVQQIYVSSRENIESEKYEFSRTDRRHSVVLDDINMFGVSGSNLP